MMWGDRRTYICVACRFTSKFSGRCPHCRVDLRAMYDFRAPRKRDDKGWGKVKLALLVKDSGIEMCPWECCTPRRDDFNRLTLSQLKTRVRRRLAHKETRVPKRVFYNYR